MAAIGSEGFQRTYRLNHRRSIRVRREGNQRNQLSKIGFCEIHLILAELSSLRRRHLGVMHERRSPFTFGYSAFILHGYLKIGQY